MLVAEDGIPRDITGVLPLKRIILLVGRGKELSEETTDRQIHADRQANRQTGR